MSLDVDPQHVLIATGRQMHYRLPANSLIRRGFRVTMNTSTPSGRMRGFDPGVRHQFTPQPANVFHALTRVAPPHWLDDADSAFFDRLSALRLGDAGLVVGAASSSLTTGIAAKHRGAKYVLDRACPDIRVQQDLSDDEARKLGGTFSRSAPWFIDRQLQEYEQADVIVAPSEYSRGSYPEHLRAKTIVAPLLGRAPVAATGLARDPHRLFTVGVVGGDPIRKGYLYLLEAWKALGWTDAKLLLRSSGDIHKFPVLSSLLKELPNVEIVGYVADLSDFYHRCDAFVLPSIDDGFGMALFEGLAHGLPCIATKNCGASELLRDGEDALIVDPFSSEQLAAALTRLREEPELRQRLPATGALTLAALYKDGRPVLYERGMDEMLSRLGYAIPQAIR